MNTCISRAAVACALLASTCHPSPVLADDYIPPKVDTRTPTGVNLADGSLVLAETDLSIGTLTLERVHQGGHKDPNFPFFGPRMTHNFDIYVAKNRRPSSEFLPDRYKPIVHLGSGVSGPYVQEIYTNSTPRASSDDASSGRLSLVNGAYVYTAQDGTIYTFNPSVPAAGALGGTGSQRVSRIDYPNGRRLAFNYNSGGQLKLISDNTGYALVFDYNGSGTVSAACGFNLSATNVTASSTCAGAALRTSYGYTNSRLTSVTDVLGRVTAYDYSNDRITCIRPPGYTACKIANSYSNVTAGTTYQVTQQTLGDGAVWSFRYSGNYTSARDPELYAELEPSGGTSVTDPNGQRSFYSFVKTSPYDKTDANSNKTSYRYTGGHDYEAQSYPELAEGSRLVEARFPEGNAYLVEYHGPYNSVSKETWTAKPGSGLADAVLSNGYDCPPPYSRVTCTRPIWKRDAKGNQTDYTYAPEHGGVLTETEPAQPDGVRPQKRYRYEQRYAWLKNTGGGWSRAGSPVWLLMREAHCRTGAAAGDGCSITGDEVVTSYDYGPDAGPNTLLLRGKIVTADGQSLRTCFRYDAQGRKVSETSPRANLGVCQ